MTPPATFSTSTHTIAFSPLETVDLPPVPNQDTMPSLSAESTTPAQ
jgi:hypothetical protein